MTFDRIAVVGAGAWGTALANVIAHAGRTVLLAARHRAAADVRGVEIGGAAKNVLAIAAGIVAGRGLGASADAALVTRGFAELFRFGRAFGARPETLTGLSGLGDVILTCSNAQSRNYSLGIALGRGDPAHAGGALRIRHLHQHRGGEDAFGERAAGMRRIAPTERHAVGVVARLRVRAGEDHVAEPGQAGQRLGARAECAAEAKQLGETARHQRGVGAGAEPAAGDDAGGDG